MHHLVAAEPELLGPAALGSILEPGEAEDADPPGPQRELLAQRSPGGVRPLGQRQAEL